MPDTVPTPHLRDAVANEIPSGVAASCFFTSFPAPPYRKAVLQITERCNLHCVHCFVSAGPHGDDMSPEAIDTAVVPRLLDLKVSRVIVTGGEPFAHPSLVRIVRSLSDAGIQPVICTNGTLIGDGIIDQLKAVPGVSVNVSLDGFSDASHNRFRVTADGFQKTTEGIRALAQAGLLQGILVTPHLEVAVSEFSDLCDFAIRQGASYVLMNRLSGFGRGERSLGRFGTPDDRMKRIAEVSLPHQGPARIALVRFPNDDLPLMGCGAARSIIGIDVHGTVSACPYLVFAARTGKSRHAADEFVIGNILTDPNIAELVDGYGFGRRYKAGNNATCGSCAMEHSCGKGCPAAVVAQGDPIGEIDREVCPKAVGTRSQLLSLQLVPQ